MMTRFTPHLLTGLVVGYFVACSPVKFEKDPEINKCQNFSQTCVTVNGYDQFEYSLILDGGQVDILFVDDNSGSMSFEHEKIATKFPNFLTQLDARNIDYRIGIVTTDISETEKNPPRVINQNGALQNGRLIKFPDGSRFLTPNSSNKEQQFLSTIERDETIQCDNYIKSWIDRGVLLSEAQNRNDYVSGYKENCPSGDERGIYSAYLAVGENLDSFIRARAHLAIVVISDENNRSVGITDPTKSYSLEKVDMPETLISLVSSKFQGDKSLAAHAIVVKSGDLTCLNEQNSQLLGHDNIPYIRGSYGSEYERFASLTNGVIGSVCASDYGQQLGTIGSAIVNQVNSVMIACENPKDLDVQLNPEDSSNAWTLVGKQIKFSKAISAGSQLTIRYSCPTL